MRQAVQDVALVTETLEAAGGVDAEVVAGAVEGALVDVCAERRDRRLEKLSDGSNNHNTFFFFFLLS